MENTTNQTVSKLGRAQEVTTFSKYLALILFIVMPFVGGYIGYVYGKASVLKAVVIPTVVEVTESSVSAVSEDTLFEELTDFYTLTTVYPNDTRDKTEMMAAYVNGLITAKQTEWKQGGDVEQVEAAISTEFPSRPKVTYVLDVRYSSTSSQKLGTVSYTFLVSEMTGGANGNAAVTTFTFDDAGVIAIDSILDYDNYKDIALTRLLAEVAIKQNPEAFQSTDQLLQGLGLAYLKSDGVTFDSKACGCDGFFFPSNFQNFSLTDTGITFTFSKYAIAPGAVMTPDITLTWAELAPFLTEAFSKRLAV